MPEPVLYTPSGPNSSRASSIFTSTPSLSSEEDILNIVVDYEGYDSPPPADERIADMRNERRYRLLLVHEFHPSRTFVLLSLDSGAESFFSDVTTLEPYPSCLGCCWLPFEAEGDICDAFQFLYPREVIGWGDKITTVCLGVWQVDDR